MTRPLTDFERRPIERARHRIEKRQHDLEAATLERDLAILEAYNRRANVGDLAEAAGISRQTVHAIINRLGER
jgi:DNA-binding MarR family transcriptional regulator